MNVEQTGRFIAELRKEKGWTQAQLAQQLGVTDKAISRWETGKGLPDTALLQPLGVALGVSVGELLAGARLDTEEQAERSDTLILDALRYSHRMLDRTMDTVLLFLGTACFLSPLFLVGSNGSWVLGFLLCGLAAVRMILRRKKVHFRSRIFLLLGTAALAAAFGLELLPLGAVLAFCPAPDIPPTLSYFSYFDLTVFGYANFTPLLTGLLTVAALISAVLALILSNRAGKTRDTSFLCSSLALPLSLVPLLFGRDYMTWASYTISFLLLLALCLLAFSGKES